MTTPTTTEKHPSGPALAGDPAPAAPPRRRSPEWDARLRRVGLRLLGALRLAPLIPLLPFYWCLMSLAAWQALFQFLKAPSTWEKTTHGVARDRRTPTPAL